MQEFLIKAKIILYLVNFKLMFLCETFIRCSPIEFFTHLMQAHAAKECGD